MSDIINKKYVLFDLDGTITDSGPAIISSFKYSIKEYGNVNLTDSDYSSIVGPPLRDSYMRLLGVDGITAWDLVLKYREFYNAGGMFDCTVYDGIEELLKALKSSGKILAVATSKPEEQSLIILKHFDLLKYFDVVAGDDQNCTRSNKALIIEYALEKLGNPNRSDVVMIGDRSYDMVGAIKTGVTPIGVAFGYGSRKELADSGAQYIANKATDLIEVLI
ncbi:MAG: HAD-IA family hydrolase [Clostridia bacterium]|nr:HAD-IA family hydrolase [Clostridia bacterium]MBO7156783.1 HAD-IA family hydrolase [Clostridia bacterium]